MSMPSVEIDNIRHDTLAQLVFSLTKTGEKRVRKYAESLQFPTESKKE